MSATHPNYFIPHIARIFEIVEDIHKHPYYRKNISAEDKNFIQFVIDRVPEFVKLCREDQKHDVYQIILAIVFYFEELVCNKHTPVMWDCLKIGINEINEKVRRIAQETFIHFSLLFESELMNQEYVEVIFTSILQVIESYCQEHRMSYDYMHSEVEDIILDSLKRYSQAVGNNIVTFLPNAMDRLLNALDPSNEKSRLIIYSIQSLFDAADENIAPYLPRMTSEFKEFLAKTITEHEEEISPEELAMAIGDGEFMRFFLGLVIELLAESSELEVRSGLYSLFIEMDVYCSLKSVENEFAPYMPTVVTTIVASVQRNESNAIENIHLKEQEIKFLKSLAKFTDTSFAPYIQSCFDAVYDQLAHPGENIRKASIEAVTQFLVYFSRTNQIEQAQRIGVDIIPKFANILKTDSAFAIAISVIDSYKQLLRESPIVFDDKMQLFNEVFNCINDVMSQKLACRAVADSFENRKLFSEADDLFRQLAKVIQPFEFAIYFNSILPFLRDRLEKATLEKDYLFLEITWELVSALKWYASTFFDELFPLLFSGLQYGDGHAVFGMGELLLHGGEKANEKSEQVLGEFSRFLENENQYYLVNATCATIARLISGRSKLISVEKFLPKIVDKLNKKQVFYFEDVFICFHTLLDENNGVLLPMLYPIIGIGLRKLLGRGESEVINGFLKECRKRFSYLIDLALDELPEAIEIVRNL